MHDADETDDAPDPDEPFAGPSSRSASGLRVALAYALFGALWIVVSDRLVHGIASGPDLITRWQTAKGWVFVAASAALIFGLVRRERQVREGWSALVEGLVDLLPDPVLVLRHGDDEIVSVNRAFEEQTGLPGREVAGRTLEEAGLELDPARQGEYRRRLEEEGEVRDFRMPVVGPGEARRIYRLATRLVEIDGTRFRVSVGRDATDEERTRRRLTEQLERVEALREIDLAITGSTDLEVSLQVVLHQVTRCLEVDAADILLAEPETRRLRFGAGHGFRTEALRHTRLEEGEGLAGLCAAETRIVRRDDLQREPEGFARSGEFSKERFVAYVAVPLVAKGEVNGVLEIFHRSPLEPSDAWFSFLEALAGQAAIAVDSARLLGELQRSNRKLRQAYDETIKGWSRALDLRDRETRGHTERVTEVTERLARSMGMEGEELLHVRWGALLHDIGKMGVPDRILHKPGPLNDREWEVMRQHPVLAYKLLSPIDFLRPALAIPYCHHEKWDGSGYPRGLRRAEIPRAARIFAVVDVWDALRSERPYREAWSEEEALAHVEEEAGAHFDPEAAEAFLELHREADLEAMRANGRDLQLEGMPTP